MNGVSYTTLQKQVITEDSEKFAFNKNVLATNPANGINLPKKIKKTEYRVLKIDTSAGASID